MERNILLRLEYDGSNFHGWQYQPGVRTVQGTLEEALGILCKCEIKVNGTSRTDSGVHALDQCCSFKLPTSIPTSRLAGALNGILSGSKRPAGRKLGDIYVKSAEEVGQDFHARFDCKGKTYVYLINTGNSGIFMRNYSYRVERDIDWRPMNEAAALLRGRHDFISFRTAGEEAERSTVRTIFSSEVVKLDSGYMDPITLVGGMKLENPSNVPECGNMIAVSVTGDGFLYNMVRIITGTLVEIGMGKRNPEDIKRILLEKDRKKAGHTAPPEGLFLKRVYFDRKEIPGSNELKGNFSE
jgi:tRNA pseudouridine38-40 synthase